MPYSDQIKPHQEKAQLANWWGWGVDLQVQNSLWPLAKA